ncbi:PH domain-containing protein [Secundilactobacillus kimchicus]|uniref:PH domain-containing protein n=1 Tax=Secundilactobacillus kimchicus TaxID=528209 RepID=UPI001C038E64|nr:PH domain-containing protein [Secundilactobacillus kimchicus]MBT9672574.1 PH domain-containing protein [Secundilactobacillus kimchicus]
MQTSHQLPSEIKSVWRMSAFGSLLIGIVIIGLLILANHFWSWPFWLAAGAGVLVVLDVVVELSIVPYRYRFWRYAINENDVEIESGFFFHHETAIPITRIQNVTLSAGPILQWFKLKTVIIETAADRYEIEAVLPETAETLKVRIMTLAARKDVEDA